MGDPTATVLVPTHEHGPLLTIAVGSALRQTVEAIEVFIVCDGATDDTLEAAHGLAEADDRVSLFVHDKGPRHGEIYRHQALREATGTIVCYLADDDLWLPGHVAAMSAILETVDFAHACPIALDPDGRLSSWPGHLRLAESRQSMREGRNFIPLSCAGHTRQLYERLPFGWRTAPADTPTDLYMWLQIESVAGVRLGSFDEATVLHFPSPPRVEMTIEERFDEIERWSVSAAEPGFAADLDRRYRELLVSEWAKSAVRYRRAESDLEQAKQRESQLSEELRNTRFQLGDEQEASAALDAELGRLRHRLHRITGSRTWRLRAALLTIPGVAWLARKAGGARSQ